MSILYVKKKLVFKSLSLNGIHFDQWLWKKVQNLKFFFFILHFTSKITKALVFVPALSHDPQNHDQISVLYRTSLWH